VQVTLDLQPGNGRLGAVMKNLFGEHPQQQLRDDLEKFRQIMETGGVRSADSSLSGRVGKQKALHGSGPSKAGSLASAAGADHDRNEATSRPSQVPAEGNGS
jgi:hypothetical protein